MKGYMKKMKSKRVLALLMAALMVMTLMVPQTVSAASPEDRYTGGTKITELLTNYQYVIRNDAVLENHTVGAVAVGGKLNAASNTIGDGAQSPSYAKYILAANIGNGSGYGAATRDFYYGDSLNALPDDFTENEDYMNLETIFGDATTGLIKQSADLAVGATIYTCNENSAMGFPVIEITLIEDNMNIEIPYTELVKAKGINLNIADIDNLSKYAYTINITGVEGNSVMFEGEAWKGVAGEPSVDVFVNGKQYAFLGDMSGQVHGIECNLSGMKLIWNFPGATGNIEWSAMGGHVVAPQAGVKVTSGRFQGGIIANSFTGTGESHFYPYGEINLNMLQSINITKKYVDADGNTVETTEQAVFGLFTDEDCKIPVKDADGNAVTATVSATTGVASFLSESLGLDRTLEYYVKEISAPEGFEINDTVYMCQFTAGGLVSYCELGKDGVPVYSLTSPVVENLKTSYATDKVGALIVTVLDKDTREVIEGVKITVVNNETGETIVIKDGDNNIIDSTNKNGVITYEDIAQGEYTVTMTIPEGYVSNDAYSVEVDVLHTTYHTFELEQVKEPIVVYLKEEGTDNKVTDGAWVQLQTKDENGNWVNVSSAWTGSLGQVTFKDNVAGDYRVVLGSDPAGWNLVDTQTKEEVVIVAVSDGKDVNEHTFYFDKKVGDVEVTIYEYDAESSTTTTNVIKENGASVTLTQADGTKTVLKDDGDGVVLFENVPVGDVTVELTISPNGYMKPSDSTLISDTVTVAEGTVAEGSLYAEKIDTTKYGELIIVTETVPESSANGAEATFEITHPDGTKEEVTMSLSGSQTVDNHLPVGDYIVKEIVVEDGWKTTSDKEQVVTVTETLPGVAEYEYVQIGSIEIAVVEKDTTNNVGQAIVTVKDEKGDSVVTMTTTSGSNLEIKDLPVGDYTVVVVAPNGYVESGKEIDATLENSTETKITVTAGRTTKAEAELTRIGALTVTVVDKADPTTVVPGVVVTVYDSANALVGGGTTNKDGQVVVNNLPAGSYTATYTKFASGSSSAQIYDLSTDKDDTTEIATITATEDGKAQLEVIKATGDLTVIVKDEKTGDPIDGAIVEITAPDGTKTEYTTDDSGKIELPDQDLGKYTVEVKDVPDDYNMPSQPKTNVTLDKDGEEVVEEVTQYVPGTLVIQIVDENGKIIEETATVTVESTADSTVATLTNGVADCGTQTAGDYIVKIIELPDEYELVYPTESVKTATVEDGKETVVKFVLKEIKYDLTVIVKDKDTNEIVSGTTVEILDENGKTVIETTTDDNGEISVEVPMGDYTIVVKDVPDGYDNPSDDTNYVPTEVEVTKDTREFVEFIGQTVIPPVTDGTLIIKVIDQNGNKVDGAVVVVDSANTAITGGEYKDEEVPAGDYALELKESGIPTNYILNPTCDAEQTAEIIAGKTTTITYQLIQTAKVDITVKEEGTDEPIPGAKVEVEIDVDNDGTPEGTITGTTNNKGEVTLDVPVKDDTVIKVTDVPEGYDEPKDQVIDVKPGDNKADFVVEPIGKVTVTVYDKLTGAVVPEAGVALLMHATGNSTEKFVSDANGNKLVLMTNANGQATFDKLADGTYSAVVDSVPVDYILAAVEGAADQATVTNGNHAYALHKLYAVGNMSITVVNKTTGQVVPNADVTVVGPTADGTNKQEVNTGATGTIVLKDQIIGDYTLTADAVTDCEFYGGVSNGNLTVEKGETAEQKFEVVQTAGMTITVVDKETGDPIKDADITVTDPYGDAKDYTTDDNGQVTIDKQPVGENTVVINRVPSTNVLPDDTDETITTTVGGSNEVKIEAPKPSTEKGNLTITVVDQVTGAIVPGATVEIKDPSGNVMGTVITDDKGQIKYTDIATGKYTVTVQDVPSGYTKPTGDPTYVTVQVGDNTVKLEIKKPAASGGGTASKPAPAPSTNTTVITNITVEKAPKTGDISYMPFAVAMMVISVLGLAGITVYRKKTENER